MHKLFLSPEQQAILLSEIQETAQKVVDISWENPEDDQRNIRRSIYLRGRLEATAFLLRDEFPEPELPQTDESES